MRKGFITLRREIIVLKTFFSSSLTKGLSDYLASSLVKKKKPFNYIEACSPVNVDRLFSSLMKRYISWSVST
jgi:hypothetical protein